MFVKVNSCANVGLDCALVEVEADIIKTDQFAFIIVGLADAAIQEARERVRLAVKNCGFHPPRYKTIINLAPADLHKEGAGYDLAIAVCLLKCSGQINSDVSDSLFIGELSLDGQTRPTNGILSAAIFAKEKKLKNIFVPEDNAPEAGLISGINIFPVKNLKQLTSHLQNETLIAPRENAEPAQNINQQNYSSDMANVCGQEQAKRALEIAAAGGHNLLMSGPPGAGKTLLARTLPTILPSMTEEEMIEVTKIYSVSGLLTREKSIITERPFRAPHHTSSGIALVGGGKMPRPGEISLSHRGILFLDEFPEFPRQVIECLRQPLEDGVISIARAQGTLTFPARFTLIASQNPCPCGYLGDPEKRCICAPGQILKYQKKVSGPVFDRIDLHIEVPRVKFEKLQETTGRESSAQIRERVERGRAIQKNRFKNTPIKNNAEMRPQDIKIYCPVDAKCVDLLKAGVNQFHLSARSFHRILKVSRTIADLAGTPDIELSHIAEALQYRLKE